MTFNPNLFDAYDTNLIVDAIWFQLEHGSFKPGEWEEYRDQATLIVDKLIGTD